jgi:hypothetical protein
MHGPGEEGTTLIIGKVRLSDERSTYHHQEDHPFTKGSNDRGEARAQTREEGTIQVSRGGRDPSEAGTPRLREV